MSYETPGSSTLAWARRSIITDFNGAVTWQQHRFAFEGIAACLWNLANDLAFWLRLVNSTDDGTWRILMKTAFAALAFLLAASAAACNTVEGVGEDVTAAGTAVDRAAEDAAH